MKLGGCHEVTPLALTRCFRPWKARGKCVRTFRGSPVKFSWEAVRALPSHWPPVLLPLGLFNNVFEASSGAFFNLNVSKAFLVLGLSDSRNVRWKKTSKNRGVVGMSCIAFRDNEREVAVYAGAQRILCDNLEGGMGLGDGWRFKRGHVCACG